MPDIVRQHCRWILNAAFNQKKRGKYHTCHSNRALWEISAHTGAQEAMWHRPESSWIWIRGAKTCSAFKYHWPYMHAFHCRLNYLNRIWTSAPGWGCHGYWAPQSVSLYHQRTHISARFSNLKMWVSEISSKILCRWGAVSSCSCEAGKLSNTQRDCADPDLLLI